MLQTLSKGYKEKPKICKGITVFGTRKGSIPLYGSMGNNTQKQKLSNMKTILITLILILAINANAQEQPNNCLTKQEKLIIGTGATALMVEIMVIEPKTETQNYAKAGVMVSTTLLTYILSESVNKIDKKDRFEVNSFGLCYKLKYRRFKIINHKPKHYLALN